LLLLNTNGYQANGVSNFLSYNQEFTWKNGASQLAGFVPASVKLPMQSTGKIKKTTSLIITLGNYCISYFTSNDTANIMVSQRN
jgi:hypothetical protein